MIKIRFRGEKTVIKVKDMKQAEPYLKQGGRIVK